MATLMTIEGTAQQGILLRDALCANYKYQEQISNPDYDPGDPDSEELIPNPESQAAFARRMITNFLKDNVRKYRADQADAARVQALEDADTESTGINTN